MTDTFYDSAASEIQSWHRALHGDATGAYRGDRASRARLRRCATLMDAIAEPQAHTLLQRLRRIGLSTDKDEPVLLLAIVLANVTPGGGLESFATMLGRGGDGTQLLSHNRFHALLGAMRSGDSALKIRLLRRALQILGEARFSQRRFITDLLWFSDATARRWNYDYWQTPSVSQPAADDAPASENL